VVISDDVVIFCTPAVVDGWFCVSVVALAGVAVVPCDVIGKKVVLI